ncbi:hypothetical protein CK203_000121 [Vitis vinifera]|uniref:Retrotransposon Copia-like N-terminal domain-containing protein n=1 Tax=Vitis vinifera TaxID=29760 RepID=A0A438KPN9_VITVI|nr:hypothetical protein CK203_000121 [Vitis vinifera]
MVKTTMTGHARDGTSEVSSETITQPSNSVYASNIAESHTLQITQHKLNGTNYLDWFQSVLLIIHSKGRLGYLTEDSQKPTATEHGYLTWESENSMVMVWLVNSMEPKTRWNYLSYKTLKEIWDTAKVMYSDLGNVSQLFELQSELKEKKQGDSMVTNYYNTLISLWQELDLFDDNTRACPDCSIRYIKKLEKERLFAFLHGLNKDLNEVHECSLGTKPLPGIQDVFSKVRWEESRKRVMHKTSKDPCYKTLLLSQNIVVQPLESNVQIMERSVQILVSSV